MHKGTMTKNTGKKTWPRKLYKNTTKLSWHALYGNRGADQKKSIFYYDQYNVLQNMVANCTTTKTVAK